MSLSDAQELWKSTDPDRWEETLVAYPESVSRQDIKDLADLDRWYRMELPPAIAARQPAHLELDELVRITRWKMLRGEWRPRNLMLVESNPPEDVRAASQEGFALAPDPRKPVARVAKLAGVGPATASAVLGAYRPDLYPFLDELVGAAIPELGEAKFTVPYYLRYAAALVQRATELGPNWTAQAVGLALWSAAGGKAGAQLPAAESTRS